MLKPRKEPAGTGQRAKGVSGCGAFAVVRSSFAQLRGFLRFASSDGVVNDRGDYANEFVRLSYERIVASVEKIAPATDA